MLRLVSQAGARAMDPQVHVRDARADQKDRRMAGELQRAATSARFAQGGVQERGR